MRSLVGIARGGWEARSIGLYLRAGIAGIAGLTVLVAVVALSAFVMFSINVGSVAGTAVPALTQANELRRAADKVDRSARNLANLDGAFAVQSGILGLRADAGQLAESIDKLDESVASTGEAEELNASMQLLTGVLERLESLVERRIALDDALAERAARLAALQRRIEKFAWSGEASDDRRQAAAVPMMRAAGAQLAAIASDDPKEVDELKASFDRQFEQARQKVDGLQDEGSVAPGRLLAEMLLVEIKTAADIFDQRIERLLLDLRFQGALRRMAVMDRLAATAAGIADRLSTAALAASADAEGAIALPSYLLIGMSLIGVLGAVALAGFVDRRVVTRIKRLHRAMTAHDSGAREGIEVDGRDEIADMARSFASVVDAADQKDSSFTQRLRELDHVRKTLADQDTVIHAAVDNLPDGIFVLDRNLRFRLFNRRCATLLGVKPDLLGLGEPVRPVMVEAARAGLFGPGDEDELVEQCLADFASQEPAESELRAGEGRILSARKMPLRDGGLVVVLADVTEHKRCLEGLARAEEQNGTLIANMPGAVYRLALDGQWTVDFVSDAVERLSGRPAGDFIGRPASGFAQMIHAEDRQKVRDVLVQAAQAGARYDVEYRIVRGEGEVRWIAEQGWVSPAEGGAPAYFDGILLDVTDRKTAEAKLAERTRVLDAVLAGVDQGVSLSDEALEAVAFNDKFLDLAELPKDRFAIGDSLEAFIRFSAERGDYGPGDVERMVRERIGLAKSFEPQQAERVRSDGTVVEIRSRRIPGIGHLTTCSDVTVLRRAEQQAGDGERRLRAILEHCPVGVAITRIDDGSYIFANRRYVEDNGYEDTDGVIEGTAIERYADPDQRADIIAQLEREGAVRDIEVLRRRCNGSRYWDLMSVYRHQEDGVDTLLSWHADITERKRAELEVKRSRESLDQILASSPAGISIIDRQSRQRMYVNDRYLQLFGAESEAQLASQDIADSYVERADLQRVLARLESQERQAPVEVERRRFDATTWWSLIDHDRVFYQGREALILWHYDITDRKRAEERLGFSERRLRHMLEGCPIGTVVVRTGDGTVASCNAPYAGMVGEEVERVVGRPGPQSILDAVPAGGSACNLEARLEPAGAEPLSVLVSVVPTETQDGEPARLCFVRDVTGLEDAERQAALAGTRIRSVLDTTAEGVWMIDPDGRIVDANPAICRILGQPREALLGQRPASFTDEAGRDIVGRSARSEVTLVRPDGGTVACLASASDYADADGKIVGTIVLCADISDLKRHEQRLRRSDTRLRRVLEAAPVGIGIARVSDGSQIYVNAALARLLAAEADHLIGRQADEPWVEREAWQDFVESWYRDGEVAGLEARLRSSDGGERRVVASAMAEVETDDGEPARLVWYTDVTDRKIAEEQLRQTLAQLSESADLLTRSGQQLQQAHAQIGESAERLSQREARLHETENRLRESVERLTQSEEDLRETRSRLSQGEQRSSRSEEQLRETRAQLSRTAERLSQSEQQLHQMQAQVRQSGERLARSEDQLRQARARVSQDEERMRETRAELSQVKERLGDSETRLSRSGDRLRAILDGSPIGALIVRASDGRVTFANRRMAEMLGRAPEEIAGGDARRYGFEPAAGDAAPPPWRADGSFDESDLRLRRADGSELWVRRAARPLTTEAGEAARLSWYDDISHRKHMEAELSEAKQAAAAGSGAKAELLASVSREMRRPMTGIVGMADLLWKTDLDGEQRRMLGNVRDSGRACLGVINQFRDLSKIEAGELRLEPAPTSIEAVVEGSAAMLAAEARCKGVQLVTRVAPDIPPRVLADPVRLRQIVVNLVGNALDFADAGDIVIHAARAGTDDRGRERIRIEVVDQGPSQPTTEDGPSTERERNHGDGGLRLSICRRLAELMGGEIGIDGNPGEGTTVHIELPLPRADAGPTPRAQPTQTAPVPSPERAL